MDHYREHARRCLETKGFQTKCIDEGDEERADLFVSDSAAKYVVEVKGKEASEAYRELCTEADNGAIATLERSIGYRNRLDAIVRKAASQLANTASELTAFRLLWVSCLTGEVDFIHQQFQDTLYGQRLLSAFNPSLRSCLAFTMTSVSFSVVRTWMQ